MDRRHVSIHHIFYAQDRQRVDAVLARDVITATRDLLSQDRAAQHEHCDGVRRDAADEKRGQEAVVGSEFECEDHRGQRRAHRAAHHGGHADRGPEARVADGDVTGFERAECAAHHEERREHAARRAGAERDGPDERLADQ